MLTKAKTNYPSPKHSLNTLAKWSMDGCQMTGHINDNHDFSGNHLQLKHLHNHQRISFPYYVTNAYMIMKAETKNKEMRMRMMMMKSKLKCFIMKAKMKEEGRIVRPFTEN